MTQKNPYELRFDLLQYARMNLIEEYVFNMESYKENKNATPESKPKIPTKEDIFKLAEEYKAFIEKK